MGCQPRLVTVVVDNAAALQSAAGHGLTSIPAARLARQSWQAAQSRVNTCFRHVHSHTGIVANTLADVLAEGAAARRPLFRLPGQTPTLTATDLEDTFPHLWLLPFCGLENGTPCLRIGNATAPHGPPTPPAATVPPPPEVGCGPVCSLPIHVTANVQTIKDATPSIFNPSGLAARRQYLYSQVRECQADVVCLQEARSRAGRWNGPGLLTWRSGAHKGQYGCEVWINAAVVHPPLQLSDWRILHSTPRLLCVTCVAARFPVTVISAHAPHADRPDSEARSFWKALAATTRRTPASRALLVGLDANGDLHAADDEGFLIGDLLARSEPARNDDLLLEYCLTAGLEAPSTFSATQIGPGWSWQHTSGRRKRLDYLLYRPGPWTHTMSSQAVDLDIVNTAQDHVALRVRSTLTCPRPRPHTARPRRATANELLDVSRQVWRHLRPNMAEWPHRDAMTSQLQKVFNTAVRQLPPKPPVAARQPYLHANTLQAFMYLRDWRAQIRTLTNNVRLTLLKAVWDAWHGHEVDVHFSLYQQRLVLGAYWLQERALQRSVHNRAKKDKLRHMHALTSSAVDAWHSTGQPMQAILPLRWASRRAADRRAVYAAGGYNIEAELEEHFRLQEGGEQVSPGQLAAKLAAWTQTPSPSCLQALPTLSDLEQCCLRQKIGKAPGPDQIPNEVWRQYPPEAGRWLWQLCSQTALTGHEPIHFKKALQHALYKKGPAALPANYRSIALLNGVAKIWHSHLRGTLGASVIRGYDDFQLGGRKQIPVAFAVATFRSIWELGVQQGFCSAALFIDIQAAYYETSRQLLFWGDSDLPRPQQARLRHLAALTDQLASQGALAALGTPEEEVALLLDCVSCSHWQLVGSNNVFAATRGSPSGDGLADVLFGGLFAIALRHIRATCAAEGIAHTGAGALTLSFRLGGQMTLLSSPISPAPVRYRLNCLALPILLSQLLSTFVSGSI